MASLTLCQARATSGEAIAAVTAASPVRVASSSKGLPTLVLARSWLDAVDCGGAESGGGTELPSAVEQVRTKPAFS
jgi:hypothetical protein